MCASQAFAHVCACAREEISDLIPRFICLGLLSRSLSVSLGLSRKRPANQRQEQACASIQRGQSSARALLRTRTHTHTSCAGLPVLFGTSSTKCPRVSECKAATARWPLRGTSSTNRASACAVRWRERAPARGRVYRACVGWCTRPLMALLPLRMEQGREH